MRQRVPDNAPWLTGIDEIAKRQISPNKSGAGAVGVYTSLIGDVFEFSIVDGALSAVGELTADLISISPGRYRAARDRGITVQFDEMEPESDHQGTVIAPFYRYTVYRRPENQPQPSSASALSSAS